MRPKFEYQEDCIHLKACRRLQQIARNLRFQLPRYCTEECTAYVSGNKSYVTTDEAVSYARSGADSIRSGYDEYDVYCTGDLGRSLMEIVNDEQDR